VPGSGCAGSQFVWNLLPLNEIALSTLLLQALKKQEPRLITPGHARVLWTGCPAMMRLAAASASRSYMSSGGPTLSLA
jgi:hypothetical protein